MLSGWLLLFLGLVIIGHLHAAIGIKVVLGAVWIADTMRELRRQTRGCARVCRLALDSQGQMTGLDALGKDQKIQILKGSVVLRRWAWLRMGFDDGEYYVEFIRRRDCQSATWRRLQLIWRHAV